MFTRRDAMKLSVAGMIAPSFGLAMPDPTPVRAQELAGSVPMFRGNAARTGEMPGPGPDATQPISVAWSFHAEGSGTSQPAVIDGKAYFGTEDSYESFTGNFFVLDTYSGQELWRTTDNSFWGNSPTVVDSLVYVDGGYTIMALDTSNGQERWSLRSNDGFITSPAVVDQVLYICSNDGYVYALDASQGQELWRLNTGKGDNFGFESWAPVYPAVENGVVYITSGNGDLHAIDAASGLELWAFSAGAAAGLSTPAVANGCVFVTSYGDGVLALDAATGETFWHFQTFSFSEPTVVDGTVYIGSADNRLYAMEAESGINYPVFSAGDSIFSSCAATGNTLYFGSDDNNFYAINRDTGEELWRLVTEGRVRSSPAILDGVVYVLSEDSNLYAVGNGTPSTAVPVLVEDVVIRGGPTLIGVERGTANTGAEAVIIGPRVAADGIIWIEVAIEQVTGWIPLNAIDPVTIPPAGVIEQQDFS